MITMNSQTSTHEDHVVEEFYEQLEGWWREYRGRLTGTGRNKEGQQKAMLRSSSTEHSSRSFKNPGATLSKDGTGTADTRRTTRAMPIPNRIREAETSTPNTCGTSTAASCCVVVICRPCSPKRIQAFVSPRNLSRRTQNNSVLSAVTTLSESQENMSSPLPSGDNPWLGHVARHDTIPKTVL